ncbi:hypothetical protein DC74_2635 [Streptomyces noursei]|uniref:Uncharacterized protein n=1 Tax=Streptomyces noursei TaxID=1971 RepID=A0A059W5P1_STRNR|nr:hypothetical protein DC74_2635 [Streptomyces noursei]GCB87971.1 hypothetical protein SALB_00640 [Streptomyces noursei]GCB92790.1 hypothetical protein SALB_05565 [Streptomyces noursei]
MSWHRQRFPLVPPEQAETCCRCGKPTRIPVPVHCVPRASGPDVIIYACPNCAVHLVPGPLPGELK